MIGQKNINFETNIDVKPHHNYAQCCKVGDQI